MKCGHCNKPIDEIPGNYVVTAPDGDVYHADVSASTDCYREHKKERERFFNETIQDDDAFAAWMGVPSLIKTDK